MMAAESSILLVEDNRDELDVALRAMRQAGLEESVIVARDGQEALESLGLEDPQGEAAAARPRVVFLDLKMPRVDGFEVLRRIRSTPETAHLPVVVVSASQREPDVRKSYELGANSFLVKQYDRGRPGEYLADAARYWLDLNIRPPASRSE